MLKLLVGCIVLVFVCAGLAVFRDVWKEQLFPRILMWQVRRAIAKTYKGVRRGE